MIQTQKLGYLVRIRTGKLDANASSSDGKYPFFTCSRDALRISTYSYDTECVLVAGNGDLNVKYYKGRFDAYQRTYIVESLDEEILSTRYLYWFLFKYVEKLRELSIGGVIKYIKLNNLTDPLIPLPTLQAQRKIVKDLETANILIQKRKEALELLDNYLVSKFNEIFGDPMRNNKNWDTVKLKDVASIKIGPFGSLLHKSDYVMGGLPLVNPKHMIKGTIITDPKNTITPEKRTELTQYLLRDGDLVVARRGEIGRCALVTSTEDGYLCGTGSMFIRPHKTLNPIFLKLTLMTPYFVDMLNNLAKGVTMKNLNANSLKELVIPLPSLKYQHEFQSVFENTMALKYKMHSQLTQLEDQFDAQLAKTFKSER